MADPAKKHEPEPDPTERAALERLEQAEEAMRAAPTPRVLRRAAELLERARQEAAWAELLPWLLEGQPPITDEEMEAARREWRG